MIGNLDKSELDRQAGRAFAALGLAAAVVLGVVAALPRTPDLASAALGGAALLTACVCALIWRTGRPAPERPLPRKTRD